MESTKVSAPDSQVLHDRAASSARETRAHVMTMATGSLAVFFLALTAEIKPPLSTTQEQVIVVVIVLMAVSILSGLWSAITDAQWSYCWAKVIESEEREPKQVEGWTAKRDRWHAHKRWSEQASLVAFVLGVIGASVYLWLRIS